MNSYMLNLRSSLWNLIRPRANTKHMLQHCDEKMMSQSNYPFPTRLLQVDGYDGRKNDVIHCSPSTSLSSDSAVVYFGGDVQDFKENMEKNIDSEPFLKWSLDNMPVFLSSKFPDSHIIVVRPSRMDFGLYSCYVNFVPSIKYGVPMHRPMNNAFQHLLKLLSGVSLILNAKSNEEKSLTVDLSTAKLNLIGFSKGCVVLNQLLYEFHYIKTLTPNDYKMQQCISQIEDMYWLDAGHGAKNVWLTSRSLLQTLADSGIRIHIHVTPYQVEDDNRPWIGQEEKKFTKLLKELNAKFQRTLHFKNSKGDLNLHFEVLSTFKTSGTVKFMQSAPD